MLDHQSNYVRRSSMMTMLQKHIDILIINLSIYI